jgi:hypothetical protein
MSPVLGARRERVAAESDWCSATALTRADLGSLQGRRRAVAAGTPGLRAAPFFPIEIRVRSGWALVTIPDVLSVQQLQNFAASGYLIVPGVVREDLLMAADAEVSGVSAEDPAPDNAVGPHFYFLPPTRLPAADAALRQSGALDLAEQLVKPHHLHHAFDHIQVALNIPPYSHRPGGPHLDGHRPNQDRPGSFTMLAAIYLCDESVPSSGNLWVWPGSHVAHQALFAERGPRALLGVSGHTLSIDNPPELAEPHPLLARRGDLLLAHFLLGHNIGGNTAPWTRRILYYRLSCGGHEDRWEDTLVDAFCEYAPVSAAQVRG